MIFGSDAEISEGSTVKRIPCNYNKVVAAEVEPESFFLQPGDTLVVP